MNRLKRILWFVWPPLEGREARIYLDTQIGKHQLDEIRDLDSKFRNSLSEIDDKKDIELFAKEVYESESSRKELIENKSVTYTSLISISISIVVLIPAIFTSEWNLPPWIAIITGILIGLSLIYLFVAVYYSFLTRQIQGFATRSVQGFQDIINKLDAQKPKLAIENISSYITSAKYNEPLLIEKSNSIVVAERMLFRGLFFFVLAISLSGGTKIYKSAHKMIIGSNTQSVICEIPNVVGMDENEAIELISYQNLQTIQLVQFNNSIRRGVVISQDPQGGTILTPCQGEVKTSISAGPKPNP